jgi:hypothetical protein
MYQKHRFLFAFQRMRSYKLYIGYILCLFDVGLSIVLIFQRAVERYLRTTSTEDVQALVSLHLPVYRRHLYLSKVQRASN